MRVMDSDSEEESSVDLGWKKMQRESELTPKAESLSAAHR